MQDLTNKQIERQDFVDTAIFELLQTLNPTPHQIEWNIEMIAKIRDEIECYFVSELKICDSSSFYPYLADYDGN